ncbi:MULTISPECIES: MarR family winged helix-turn-helix transcriptional regulator [Isoptericola]|uniref:MarR family winged helix-turn-helix transcriptional regulator n=1 Tax=Isoptericola TaxID=254250 RepID=UPI001FAF1908|nr:MULTISPECIES: MarR family transcriptional regulator [Isoptericola]MCK0118220.1 winged helix DNA-binding protein [Isoptericola sp. S6320L]
MSERASTALVAALESLSRAQREAAARIARDLDWPRSGLGIVRMVRARGAVQLCEVAEALRVDASVASRQVSALVDAGYVRRTVDRADRRARTLELTDAGHAFAAESDRYFDDFVDEAFADWSAADLTDAITQIRNVAAAISSVTQEAPSR